MSPLSAATVDLSERRCSFNHDGIQRARLVFGQTGTRQVLCAEPAATCKSTHLIRLPISPLITMQPISATWRPSLNTRVVSRGVWSCWGFPVKAGEVCVHTFVRRQCRAAHFTCNHCDHRYPLNECSETHITGFHFSLDPVRSPRGPLLGPHFGNDWYTDLRWVSHELII